MLPSVSVIKNIMSNNGLNIEKKIMFGSDYAETLKRWKGSFQSLYSKLKNKVLMKPF